MEQREALVAISEFKNRSPLWANSGHKMFLRNYTSDVPVTQTIHRIEAVLIQCGVTGITKEYGPVAAEVVAIQFHIKLQQDKPPVTIRLPADKKGGISRGVFALRLGWQAHLLCHAQRIRVQGIVA